MQFENKRAFYRRLACKDLDIPKWRPESCMNDADCGRPRHITKKTRGNKVNHAKLWLLIGILVLENVPGANAPLPMVLAPWVILGSSVAAFFAWVASSVGAITGSGKLLLGTI